MNLLIAVARANMFFSDLHSLCNFDAGRSMLNDTPPIFVTGFPRSGTTLLGNILDRHPRIGIFVESFFIPRYYWTQVFYWPLKRRTNLLRLARAITLEGASLRNELQYDPAVIANLHENTYAALLDELMRTWVKKRGKVRWGDKSPGYATKLRILHRMYPAAKFVHIIRDGRDAWLSLRKRNWERNIVKVAQDWQSSIRAARRYAFFNLADSYLEVRYEDLVAQPRFEMQRILEFLGEEYSEAVMNPEMTPSRNVAFKNWPKIHSPISSASVGGWERELSEEQVGLFEEQAAPVLRDFDYKLTGSHVSARVRMKRRTLAIAALLERGSRIARRRPIIVLETLKRFYSVLRNGT